MAWTFLRLFVAGVKILELLEKHAPNWVKTRDIQRQLSGRIDAGRFNKAIRTLIG